MQTSNDRLVLSVSQLNQSVKSVLDAHFSGLWVSGEVSNLTYAASGHLYFSLKDHSAQVRCAMFRRQTRYLPFTPKNGMQVVVRAQAGLYEARGDFQLIVEQMQASGDGLLQAQFVALKKKLLQEGLFEARHKQPIPVLPKRIGIITSPSGAAVRDALITLQRRFAAIRVRVYPTQVQGDAAAMQIAQAIRLANRRQDCDVLLLIRGGGSLEDLWCFNTEKVARAIAASRIPLVTGIGHETDTTLADFVADARAPTPSVAAESVSPDGQAWAKQLQTLHHRLGARMQSRLLQLAQSVDWLQRNLQQLHPGHKIKRAEQRLGELRQRLRFVMLERIQRAQTHVGALRTQLIQHNPRVILAKQHRCVTQLAQRQRQFVQHALQQRQVRLTELAAKLHAMSPLATLARGYAIVTDTAQNRLITRSDACQPGLQVRIRFAHGEVYADIKQIAAKKT